MTQFTTTTPRRHGGDLDVYTGLLCAAMLALAAGVFMLANANIKHSSTPNQSDGGLFKIVSKK